MSKQQGKLEPLEPKSPMERGQQGFQMEMNKEQVPGIESSTVQFMNLEDPNVPLEFTFMRKNQKTPHKYKLFSGRTYTLPVDVIDHLNSKAYPIYENKWNAEEQQYNSVQVGMKPRFTCHPVQPRKQPKQSNQAVEEAA